MKIGKGKLASIGVLLIALSAASFLTWQARAKAKAAAAYKEIVVTRGDIKETVLSTGTVQPENRLQIKPPVGGRIEQVMVKEGDVVHRGQMLALMSSTDRAALIDAARSHGDAELAYWEDIYKPAPIVAPMAGVIIASTLEPGQVLTDQDVAMVMSDHLLVVAQVDETDMAQISQGQAAKISVDAYPQETIAAKVAHIAYDATTVNSVTMYNVKVKPDHVPDFMRSGMSADVHFMVAEKTGVLLIPVSAMHKEHGHATVYVKDPDPTHRESVINPRTVKVDTGLSDGKMIEILAGLHENDVVLQPVVAHGDKKSGANGSPFTPFGGPPPKGGR